MHQAQEGGGAMGRLAGGVPQRGEEPGAPGHSLGSADRPAEGGQHHVQHLLPGHPRGRPDRVLPARGDHARGGALRWVGDADHSGHSHDGQESYSGNTSRVTPVTSQELNFMEKFGKKIFSK